ncbi:MAG: dihydrofolate reductase [Verrucomicrobiales bacterium]|nr:dihydrofolate reductase [Verrucomicrobiales bacterium]
MFTLIAAMDENRLIGTGRGGLPWSGITRDKQHFRDYTAGKSLLIGRRTFEEMRGWFRREDRPIVMTRNPDYDPGGHCRVAGDLDDVLALAADSDGEEIVVCGGAELYRLTLPFADRLVLTLLHADFPAREGGVFFPEWENEDFVELRREDFAADNQASPSMTFLYLARRAGSEHANC